MKEPGKWREVSRGVISPEARAARLVRMAAAAAETRAALVAVRAAILAQESEEGNCQGDHEGEGTPP